jgi:hypothetical protein
VPSRLRAQLRAIAIIAPLPGGPLAFSSVAAQLASRRNVSADCEPGCAVRTRSRRRCSKRPVLRRASCSTVSGRARVAAPGRAPSSPPARKRFTRGIKSGDMTASKDIATVAGQLNDLTRTVEQMGSQLAEMRERAASQQERSDVQQERIDLAAKELAEVSDRLQAAAKALRAAV